MKKASRSDTPSSRSSWRQRISAWTTRHPQRTVAIFGLFLIAIACIAATMIYIATKPAPITPTHPATKKSTPEKKYYSPLTGVPVADDAATKQPVTAIMIENSPNARPQSGIKQAGIVYEAVAEGGITRFLALYQEAKPQLIGPVRSVRMYYVDWAAPYNASIAHIGGSAAALAEVRNGTYRDIDQFFNAGSYWRAADRAAPHNVYTSFEKLDALNREKGYTSSSFTGFTRTDGKKIEPPTASHIDMTISSAWYNTQYDYDATSNSYLRSVGGEPATDREEGRIAPSVVIALKVATTHVMEDGWRESITTSGSGSAVIFQNGTVIEGTWRKNSKAEPLVLYDNANTEIKLNRGQTWITAIPSDTGAVTWQ